MTRLDRMLFVSASIISKLFTNAKRASYAKRWHQRCLSSRRIKCIQYLRVEGANSERKSKYHKCVVGGTYKHNKLLAVAVAVAAAFILHG